MKQSEGKQYDIQTYKACSNKTHYSRHRGRVVCHVTLGDFSLGRVAVETDGERVITFYGLFS